MGVGDKDSLTKSTFRIKSISSALVQLLSYTICFETLLASNATHYSIKEKARTNQLQPALKKKSTKKQRELENYQENTAMNVFSSIIAGINLHKIHLL